MTHAPEQLAAALTDRYQLEREVGQGGMATVYLAEDLKHHRKVAVKVLRPDLAATLGVDRFFREIRIAAQLQHPHILPLLDSGEAGGFLYYVMPFVQGESLREKLARQGELPVPEAVKLLCEIADALAHAHGCGVVHRDIKPDNVMLSGRHALVMDFGVAKAVSEATGRQQLTTAGVALGTPAYMAPEQAAADPHLDHRVDIYAVGAMAYELLTGRPPFTGLSPQQVLAAQVTEEPVPVTKHRPAISSALAQVVMKCLAKRPADRWQSASELLAQLEPLATPSGGMTPTSTAPFDVTAVTAARWYGHPLRVGGLFVLASVAVLGIIYFLTIQLGLPDWVFRGASALLALGLPIMVVTGLVERRRALALATGRFSGGGETGLRSWLTWRKAIMGGVMAFAALGLGTLIYTTMRLLGVGPVGTLVAAGKLTERDRLIVADFENRTADSTLGPSVTEALRIDLAQSPVITLMSSSAVGEALQRMGRQTVQTFDAAAAREVAIREGGKAVLTGEISPVGKGFVLSAKLVAPSDGAELAALRETAEDDRAILAAIDRLSARMRERIGESLRSIRANEPLDKVTTASLEALRLYSQGVRASDVADNERAINLLEQAIAIDTGFAMAYRKLSVVLGNSRASEARKVETSTKAFQHRDRLPEVERYQTTAWYYWTVDYDPDKVISAYRAVLQINPDETTALNNLAVALNSRRQWAEAEKLAMHATEVGNAATFYRNLIDAQLSLGKVVEAQATLDRAEKALPENPMYFANAAQMAASLGAYDSARSRLQALSRTAHGLGWQAAANGGLFAVEQTLGRLRAAEQHLREQMTVNERRGLPSGYLRGAAALGNMEVLFREDPPKALQTVQVALQRYPLGKLPALDRPYSELAGFYATAGQTDQARRLLAEYEGSVPEPIRRIDELRHMAAGQLALADGRAQDAIAEFRAWYDESGCTNCGLFELGRAYELAGQPDSALAAYERAVSQPRNLDDWWTSTWTLARNYRRLGELYEERGNRDKALEYYGRFVQLWKDADPELQPRVREVKERLAKLAGEQRL